MLVEQVVGPLLRVNHELAARCPRIRLVAIPPDARYRICMKRILSLDGGGIRGVFTIAILERIEEILRARYADEKPGFVLADYFDYIGGTSTGAILAAMLGKGLSVRAIRESYETLGPIVFRRKPFWQSWRLCTTCFRVRRV